MIAFSSSSGDTHSAVPTKRYVLEAGERETETMVETVTETVPKSVDLQKLLKK